MRFIVLLILLFNIKTVLPQEYQDRSISLSRNRVSAGFVSLLSETETLEIDHPFINVSYRSSGFDKFSSALRVKGAFELGLNLLLILDKEGGGNSRYTAYPLPYAKAGPEIRLYKNFFLAANGGLAFIYFIGSLEVIPFAGVNGFYLVRISNKTCIEFETGFHLPAISYHETFFLTYLTIGISFD